MKRYIGNVLDFEGGIVRMLNTNMCLVSHFQGGINTREGDLVFKSYEESEVNLEALLKKGLRFLTKEEVVHFFRGEDLNGKKLEKPTL